MNLMQGLLANVEELFMTTRRNKLHCRICPHFKYGNVLDEDYKEDDTKEAYCSTEDPELCLEVRRQLRFIHYHLLLTSKEL